MIDFQKYYGKDYQSLISFSVKNEYNDFGFQLWFHPLCYFQIDINIWWIHIGYQIHNLKRVIKESKEIKQKG